MEDHIYKVVEIVGTSRESAQHAIDSGIARAAESIRHIRWFEVVQVRGHVVDGRVDHYQATLKIGFTLE